MPNYLYDIVFMISLIDCFSLHYATYFAKTLNTSTHQKLQKKIKDKILKLQNHKKISFM